MGKLSVRCPGCGSCDTLRLKGPEALTGDCFQQRHGCRACGCRFLVFWKVDESKIYLEGGGDDEKRC